jgi:hypothetical protein
MNHYSKELKVYAEAGLRTAEDWASESRAVREGSAPQAEAMDRGKTVGLFSRRQTDAKLGRKVVEKA